MEKIEEKQNRNQEEIIIIDRGQQEKNKANADNKLKQQEKGTAGRNKENGKNKIRERNKRKVNTRENERDEWVEKKDNNN